MKKIFQTTLSKPLIFKGIGLHSGLSTTINILPAEANSGINFIRVDLKRNNIVEANYKSVTSSKLCTTLENDHGVKVSTVEHLLAALYIADIDNALIEINAEEVPILDGSAKKFIEKLSQVKIKTLGSKRKYLKILDKVQLFDGEKEMSIKPKDSFEVCFQLNYENKIIGNQTNCVDFENDNLKNIIESRTFCLFDDIEKIKKIGLAKGGSLDNAIVVGNNKILNESGLRNEKEFVNHKILDLAGDFLLSGYRVLGNVNCCQGGHEFTNKFLRKLLSEKNSFSIIELNEVNIHQKIRLNKSNKLVVNA